VSPSAAVTRKGSGQRQSRASAGSSDASTSAATTLPSLVRRMRVTGIASIAAQVSTMNRPEGERPRLLGSARGRILSRGGSSLPIATLWSPGSGVRTVMAVPSRLAAHSVR
jgi:hypothetical protein